MKVNHLYLMRYHLLILLLFVNLASGQLHFDNTLSKEFDSERALDHTPDKECITWLDARYGNINSVLLYGFTNFSQTCYNIELNDIGVI
jgi:hypothetical protein